MRISKATLLHAQQLVSNLYGLSQEEQSRRIEEARIALGYSSERGEYVDVIDTTGEEVVDEDRR